jgi:5-methyltetrahydropteroyltriglutamate--homocysteine methyltransferase
MFATLAAGYPRPALPSAVPGDDVVRAVVAELEAAGVEILSDGGVRRDDPLGGIASLLQGFEIGPPAPYLESGRSYRRPRAIHEPRWDGAMYVRDWQTAAAATELPVKQSVTGPYTLARLSDPGPVGRERLTMALADALAHELRSLVAAGAPVIQVDEDAASLIGADPAEQRLFKAAHRRLTNTVRDAHLTLAVTGGSVAEISPATFFDAPYRSYLIDVVTAPQNWTLIREAPGERGIIAGVADVRSEAPDDPEFLTWAALYAAALRARGPDRVGLAPSGSLADVPPEAARAKIEALANVAAETHVRATESPGLLDPDRLADEGRDRGYLRPAGGDPDAAPKTPRATVDA